MDLYESIKDTYILSNIDLNFAIGRRANLRYACEWLYASLMELNPKGIDPFEYLSFAKSDILSNDPRGAINGLCNAKRAIHLTIDCFFEILGLKKRFGKKKFPEKLKFIQDLEAFPTIVINKMNEKRNYIEHEYRSIDIDEVKDFVDITEMFLLICYPFLKHMVIGIHIGLKNNERDIVWILNQKKSEIKIYEDLNSKSFNSSIGKIYYNFSENVDKLKLLNTINIEISELENFLSYLNTFIYCTKREIIPKNPLYDLKNYERLMIFRNQSIFFD